MRTGSTRSKLGQPGAIVIAGTRTAGQFLQDRGNPLQVVRGPAVFVKQAFTFLGLDARAVGIDRHHRAIAIAGDQEGLALDVQGDIVGVPALIDQVKVLTGGKAQQGTGLELAGLAVLAQEQWIFGDQTREFTRYHPDKIDIVAEAR